MVKQWLRELPEPLMTFTHYNDFLRAIGWSPLHLSLALMVSLRLAITLLLSFIELPEKQEQLQAIYKVLEQLPTANFNTLERLIFHLVRYR